MSETNKWYWVLQDISAKNAGLQVRTKPIIDELQKVSCAVLIVSIDNVVKMLMERKVPQDAIGFIFAKPLDSQSSFLMTELKEIGYPVVIDIFDNYASFSKWSYQTGIPYLWRQSLHLADAVIVSSPVIEERIHYLKPSATLIDVCDVLPWHNCGDYSLSVSQNSLKKWQSRSLKRRLLWFGISSNPWYQVGLADLIKWLPLIKQLYLLRPFEIELELVICSNLTASVLDVVMQYQQVGIQTRFITWSKEACIAELETAHCVLLPTGMSEFSRSKTHNRLSDAINNRCIVFTTAKGAYENFIGGAVQTTLGEILQLLFYADSSTINTALAETVSILERYHPFTEQVGNLAKQLGTIKSVPQCSVLPPFKFVMIGFQSPGGIAKLARKLNYLVVGYTSNQVSVTYDIYLKSIDPISQVALITCSNRGKEVLDLLGLQLTPHDETGIFSLLLPVECANNCNKLFLYSQLGDAHKSVYTHTSSLSVTILMRLLKSERSKIILADNSGLCWSSYIKTYADYLEKPIQKLESMWKKTYEMQ